MNIVWSVMNMERLEVDSVVIIVFYRATGTDGDLTAAADNAVRLPYKSPSDPSFIPYQDLTEQEVLNWVFEAIGPENKAIIERAVAGQIEQKKIVLVDGVPW